MQRSPSSTLPGGHGDLVCPYMNDGIVVEIVEVGTHPGFESGFVVLFSASGCAVSSPRIGGTD